jgi:hypothetical protein
VLKVEQLASLTSGSAPIPCSSSSSASHTPSSGCRDLSIRPYLGISAATTCKKGEGCGIAAEDGGRMNYVSLYEQITGVYKITLKASWNTDDDTKALAEV